MTRRTRIVMDYAALLEPGEHVALLSHIAYPRRGLTWTHAVATAVTLFFPLEYVCFSPLLDR